MRININNIDNRKRNHKLQENFKKNSINKTLPNNERKNSKLNKTLELDEKKIKRKNKEMILSNDDNQKQVRNNSQARRKINKTFDTQSKRTSSSYEKRNINNRNNLNNKLQKEKTNNTLKKINKDENKKINKINKIKIKKVDNDSDNDDNNMKVKKNIKPKNQQNKKKEINKTPTKTLNKNVKIDKKKEFLTTKVNKFKNDEKNKEKKNVKKFLTNKERTITSSLIRKKPKKIEENDEIEKKDNKRKKAIVKSVDKINNKKKVNNKVKKVLIKKKIKKKEESESNSNSNSDSESESESNSDSDSGSGSESESSKSSKSKKSKSSRSSKRSKSSSKSKSSKNSKSKTSSNNGSSSSPTPSSSGTNSDEEKPKEIKKNEIPKVFNKSKTSYNKTNIKLESSDKQNQKNEEKEKEKPKQENQQILNNIPKITPPVADGRKGSIILGSRYLRRRSMDNPLARERLELLVTQMTLKQNGGNTLFLKNYESGPSYQKEITFITKDKKTIKKKIKIDECTKAGCSGPGIVKTNQDAYFVKENFLKNNEYFFVGVCDGHGEQGHIVSNYVINKLPSYIKDLSNESITEVFKKINKEIYSSSKMDSNMSGTTVVSLILTPNNITCINLGDSRAALFRYENGLYYCRNLSRDHKPNEPDESRRITNNGGRVKKCYDEEHKKFIGPDRVWMKNKEEPGLAMTRSLGDKIAHSIGVSDEPEFKTFPYDGTERYIIIASDGLWEYVSGDQCISIVKPFYEDGKDSKEAALALVKEAFRKWKRKEVAIDDITVVVIFFD